MDNFIHLKVLTVAEAYEQQNSEELLHAFQLNISNFLHNGSRSAEDMPPETIININNRLEQIFHSGIMDFHSRRRLFLNTSTPTQLFHIRNAQHWTRIEGGDWESLFKIPSIEGPKI